ncbi:MAG: hypothetical protein RJA98_1941 [Pseudomonadota bacterium]|jgi:hemerythrin-like domain-containing protein
MALLMPGNTPAATFERPFDMLAACHDRVQRSLSLLERLVAHLEQTGNDAQAHHAAADVLRYFDLAAPAHHEDEERHVFPLLDASADPALRDTARQLRADHAEFNAQWQRLRPLLSQVMQGRDAPLPQLQTLVPRFAELHEQHLALENSLAFPQAHALMRHSDDPLMEVRMGEEMAGRRGVGGVVVGG